MSTIIHNRDSRAIYLQDVSKWSLSLFSQCVFYSPIFPVLIMWSWKGVLHAHQHHCFYFYRHLVYHHSEESNSNRNQDWTEIAQDRGEWKRLFSGDLRPEQQEKKEDKICHKLLYSLSRTTHTLISYVTAIHCRKVCMTILKKHIL